MATTYVKIDTSDLKGFVGKLDKAAQGEFKKELVNFMEGLGYEFLRIVQDEIIRKQTVDTRLLLNSFSKGEQDNVFVLNEGSMTIEVGTNVKYAEYADKGHWLNPKGVNTRFVPGYWQGEHFMIRILLSSRLGDRKWTQADLARKTGIRPTTINELYHEMVDRVNLDHLDLICEALDCSLDELIVRVPNKTPRATRTINGSQKSKTDE